MLVRFVCFVYAVLPIAQLSLGLVIRNVPGLLVTGPSLVVGWHSLFFFLLLDMFRVEYGIMKYMSDSFEVGRSRCSFFVECRCFFFEIQIT